MSRRPPDESSFRAVVASQSASKLLLVNVVAALAGLCAGWVTVTFSAEILDLHVAIWTFLVIWAGLVGYFFHLRVSSSVVGAGCYVMGISIILKPPVVFTTQTMSLLVGDARGVATIQGFGDLFIAVLLFGLGGAVVIALGAYFRKRGQRAVYRRMRSSLRPWE